MMSSASAAARIGALHAPAGRAPRRVGARRASAARLSLSVPRASKTTVEASIVASERTVSERRSALTGLGFSSDPDDVDPVEVAALLGHSDDAEVIAKLRAMIASPEGCLVGVFARIDEDAEEDEEERGKMGGPGGAGGGLGFGAIVAMGMDMLAGECNIEGKTLVGFAHAATDGSMVATVDLVVVGEAHRHAEVGRRLVRRLGEELHHREIYDVGVRAPPEKQTFFAKCGFGPDAEGATYMALPLARLVPEDASPGARTGPNDGTALTVRRASGGGATVEMPWGSTVRGVAGGSEPTERTEGDGGWPPLRLGDLGANLTPGRTLKDGGDGLRKMLLLEMDKADEAAAAETRRWF